MYWSYFFFIISISFQFLIVFQMFISCSYSLPSDVSITRLNQTNNKNEVKLIKMSFKLKTHNFQVKCIWSIEFIFDCICTHFYIHMLNELLDVPSIHTMVWTHGTFTCFCSVHFQDTHFSYNFFHYETEFQIK